MPEVKQSTVSQQSTTDDSVRSPLVTDMGNTTIAENVVAKLSGIAAREVPGVYSMGTAARRAFDTLTDRIPGSQTNVSGGVSVEKGEKQTAIDLTIVVEYGTSIVDVAEAIRRNVIRAVEQGTGLQVVEVNIEVTDVHLPGDEDDQQSSNDTVELN
ncbi:MAG: Asp23/Gls24 family envelope stress response protein [Brevibacterium aurantiacum]|uniref:Alkaline shock protein 23 n=1 Tax=Brevibacterium aurantiacum TaxID=273384 RepID=A0A1D7W8I1_BREAU|nr:MULTISPECIES: Asp23/Gls24 family envelope stress response protein [Brevibacterium]MDN5549559.1 Asp23/Gls24 family envelope stress response protein [Brevibacterium sp.]AOP55275.1 Alkaline shock protein 23 [Brevibacterium aurantiacum]AZL07162.1 Asp23/Gls24 family envelope stress response protein [Brevibacterium aurantiacum]AZL10768.1 Asp23/Gls24 family envelope stress response protein [Brevibacterium aurantiacum]AZL14379.1 Asp23/Gls24 family envelope stress response protein [Brevibacterium au